MLNFDGITAGSGRKVLWQCDNNPKHQWVTTINKRTQGTGCPYCSNKKVCIDNCLNNINQKLSKEWHPTKNGIMTPFNVTCGSNKKAWWICKNNHEWEEIINARNSGLGCPFCSGHRLSDYNRLTIKSPELIKQWHPTKNIDLSPQNISFSSSKKAWWICEKGHEWETSINNRTGKKGRNCPFCSNKKVNKENCLAILNPELAKEFHPIKNHPLTTFDVTCHSGKKVWWKCLANHEWEAIVDNRSKGKGCPYCSNHYSIRKYNDKS